MCKKVRFIRKQAFIPGICFSNWSSTASVTRASAGRPLPLSAKTVYKPSSLNSTPIIYKQRFEYKASLTFCSNGTLGLRTHIVKLAHAFFYITDLERRVIYNYVFSLSCINISWRSLSPIHIRSWVSSHIYL